MSTAALAWALKQPIRPSSLKFLLVACADVTPEGGLCYPSVKYLSEITCQDDKTVYNGLQKLCERGLLRDTGKRTGRTSQIVVYELAGFKTPENGSVHNGQRHPDFPSKTPVPPVQTHPKTGDGTPKEELQEEQDKKPAAQSLFERFWHEYPKKENKKKAAGIWKRRNLDSIGEMIIADVINRKLNHRPWLDGFEPHPTTYINGDRWNDAVDARGPKAPVYKLSAVDRVRIATAKRKEERDAGLLTIEGEPSVKRLT